jgi:hypothetical protein
VNEQSNYFKSEKPLSLAEAEAFNIGYFRVANSFPYHLLSESPLLFLLQQGFLQFHGMATTEVSQAVDPYS